MTDFEKAQIAGNRQFLSSLAQHGVHHTLLKGAASACLLYPERHMRAAWDFDVGVGWNDLRDAEALALAAGFHQAQRDRDAPRFYRANRRLRAIVEESHFELGFLVRRLQVTNLSAETKAAIKAEKWCHQFWHDADTDKPWCYAVLDIHHKLSLDIGLDDLLLTVTSVERSGERINVPDFAWFAAHLIFKLYWEGVHSYGKGLYQCADLVRLIPHLDEPTFDRLANILDSYNLVAGGYYAFNHLADFGIAPPPHIARFIDDAQVPPSGSDPIEINDLGDVWPNCGVDASAAARRTPQTASRRVQNRRLGSLVQPEKLVGLQAEPVAEFQRDRRACAPVCDIAFLIAVIARHDIDRRAGRRPIKLGRDTALLRRGAGGVHLSDRRNPRRGRI